MKRTTADEREPGWVTMMIRRALPYLALICVAVGFVNFFWFFAESAALGGDALNGYARDGRYFLGSHGTYTEVAQTVWAWSRTHGTSIFVTHPLAMAGGGYLLIHFVFPGMMVGRASVAATNDRIERIRASGGVLASARAAGQIGEVRFRGPLLAVSVHPAGIVIKPLFMPAHAILATEIRDVEAKRGVLGRRIEIAHASVDSASPFVLFGSGYGSVVAAIEDLATRARAEPRDEARSEDKTVEDWPDSTGDQPGAAPRGILTSLNILGLWVNFVLIGVGLFWAIPELGPFGYAWTAIAVLITIVNARRFLAGC